jgi:hypothetical protein
MRGSASARYSRFGNFSADVIIQNQLLDRPSFTNCWSNEIMDSELIDRWEQIQQRILQLRDSL